MIFLDANVFIRYLVEPVTPQDQIMENQAAALFQQVRDGKVEVTTSEATIAEVVCILSSKKHFNTPRSTVVTVLKPLLRSNAFRFASKAICLNALNIWEGQPRLTFPDSLAAAHSERFGYALATFDERLGRLTSIDRYRFLETEP